MKGVVFKGDREVAIEDFPDPTPGPGEVVVAIRASGMCGSDLTSYRRPKAEARSVVSGHEPCGVIAEVGPNVSEREARVGQRVLIHHYVGCGVCKMCRIGYTQMCEQGSLVMGFSTHGGNAPYLAIPASQALPMPDELTFAEGAAVACGTGTAYSALKRIDLSGRDTLVILGQGPVGLAATQFAAAFGSRVIAIDPVAERRALATQLGADVVIDPNATSPLAAILELTRGEGAEATLDCTGNAEARATAIKAAKSWGRVCFVGEGGSLTIDVSPYVIHKQLTIFGSWTFSTVLMAECAQFAAQRRIPLGHVFTDTFTMDQAPEAFRRFESRTMGKGVFVFG